MKLHRPYIPLYVRVVVAERMFAEKFGRTVNHAVAMPLRTKLSGTLACIFNPHEWKSVQLDHDPALTNRKFNARTKRYTPDANDPDFLVYRVKHEHEIKTRVRGDGAQLSDLALRRKFKRIERKRKPKFKPTRPKFVRRHD